LNHLGRFTEQDLEAGFVQHLEVIRHKRWLRGGVYAVDGHDIVIPYGQGYEGAHPMSEDSEGAYGYKLVVLLNIQDECELIAGYILGGLPESEITLLRRLLARLDKSMGPLREWLKILLMDRGYWGTDLVRTQTGLRRGFRKPGTGPEVGCERFHPTATGGSGSALDRVGGTAAVLRTKGDAEGAPDGVATDHLDQ
jgi:hypothetical protein